MLLEDKIMNFLKTTPEPKGASPKTTEFSIIPSDWASQLFAVVKGALKFHEPLNHHSAFPTLGTADAVVFPEDVSDLQRILALAKKYHLPWLVLGSGGHVWVKDEGFRGIVIRLDQTFNKISRIEETEKAILLKVEAGVSLSELVDYAGLLGIMKRDKLNTLRGTLGGAICRHAESKKAFLRDLLMEVTVMLNHGQVTQIPLASLNTKGNYVWLPYWGIILSGQILLKK